ncbi:hypothetical protein WBP07_30550 [Novosphingobium sp. BL-8A]|uniref:hypothetical protein n=1 Tax=Novosphingobium sp. BL-8A TaxID=3127639 RepID=UPI0037571B8A
MVTTLVVPGLVVLGLVVLAAIAAGAVSIGAQQNKSAAVPIGPEPSPAPMRVGINLFSVVNSGRQQVFSNMILQSEWFSSEGAGWKPFPVDQLDAQGWIRFLKPGQTAFHPIVLPPAPFHPAIVKCTYQGRGQIEAGGVAEVRNRAAQSFTLDLNPTGAEDEGAWMELAATDKDDPVRNIDCRLADRPATERFSPEFLTFVRQFKIIRFLDWEPVNDNPAVRWEDRTTPQSATQAGPGGVSIEDMIEVANSTGADPWFLMPYKADGNYVRSFAQLVHDRLDPHRTVYVELGNEIWNSMFDAAQQAQAEGLALGLGGGDAKRAQMLRYAQKVRQTMQIWTEVFADRPHQLVRVASSQNAWPDLASIILDDADTAQWVDALATAPYFGFDIAKYGAGDTDRIFAKVPATMDEVLSKALIHREIAARHGKRYLTYEGGQHFVTENMALAHALQRDPRMATAYADYLSKWKARIGGDLVLFSSTAPIASYGSWGLREYAGQPLDQAPKLRAVRAFLAAER